MKNQTFALYFGNRGFFPETLIDSARNELIQAVTNAGYEALVMDSNLTKFGAVETQDEGKKYAQWLKENEGNYDGVIICLPNFGDENGAVYAMRDVKTPIFIQAYPDEIGKMDFLHRRDAFCGKLSIMDMFLQYNIKFTVAKPHTVHPLSDAFTKNLHDFSAICRVVNGTKRFTIGAIGSITTAFKTVRYDEVALQKLGVTIDSYDLSELFTRTKNVDIHSDKLIAKKEHLRNYTNCCNVPEEKMNMLSAISVAIDNMIAEYHLDAISLRCWTEMQSELGVAPCVLLSELNDRGIAASCEMDVCNAVIMHALKLASNEPAMCLDWNNNYSDDENKCILFHCGPIAQTHMTSKGLVTDHKMFAKSGGAGCGWGSNEGRIKAFSMTYASGKTDNGIFSVYLGEGEFTNDKIEPEFFGCGGVAKIDNLQEKLIHIGKNGFRHHTAATSSHCEFALREAFSNYLGYNIIEI
ncbi:MAG: hypothetical protein RR444_10750 [Oscillospiraceae bacterium]